MQPPYSGRPRRSRLRTDEVEAPERPVDPADWRGHLNERLRAEFIAGAEEESRKRTGRPMTVAELECVLRRYPGDV